MWDMSVITAFQLTVFLRFSHTVTQFANTKEVNALEKL